MRETGREQLTRYVYRELTKARFRELLPARDRDGHRPLVIALPDDNARAVLEHVVAAGGSANVVIGHQAARRLSISTMTVSLRPTPGASEAPIKVGRRESIWALLQRVKSDAEPTGAVAASSNNDVHVGRLVRVPVPA